MISGYVAINGIFVILQYNQLVGGIYSHGYITDIMGRLSGLTGGSWELPAMLAMFVSSLILDDYYRDKYLRLLLIIIISALMVYLTGTRTGMIVYFIGIGFAIIANYKTNIILILTVCMTGVLFLNQDRISMITSNTFARFQGSDYPYSLQIRLNEWGEYYRHMEYYDYLVGKGIGYSGLHVDGMFAKIFIDMGVVGLILFSLYYTKLLFPYKIIGLITFIYCITIDFFTASKLMFGMYFAIYYIKQQKLQLKKRNIYYENRLKFVP